VFVDIDPEEAVVDLDAATMAGTAAVHERAAGNVLVEGRIETKGFAQAVGGAEAGIEIDVRWRRQNAAPLEARGGHAAFDRRSGRVTLTASVQMPHMLRTGIAEMIAKQREVGIDIMSDGEFWKARDQIYYGSRATGIEATPLSPGEWPSILGVARERTGSQFRDFYSAFDSLGNTPRPGSLSPPTYSALPSFRGSVTEKSVITGPVKALPPDPINQDIAVI
jgi:hypothetical protein